MIDKRPLTYSVVVRDPSAYNRETGKPDILRDCGHKHKSLGMVVHCYVKLTRPYPDGTFNPLWYYAAVEDSAGKRYSNSELDFRNYRWR
jgi:hypothetical protein